MKKLLLAALLLCAGCMSSARAAQTVALMKECANCTATQMQTMAKNSPVGYTFVYDLGHNIIRKYDVYTDSTCAGNPAPQNSATGGHEAAQASGVGGGGGVQCGSFKAADEVTPVNPGVQNIFNSLRAAWLVNPTLANTAKARRVDPPINPNTGQPFNIPAVGWDYPQGEYRDLYEYLRDVVLGTTRAAANDFAPGLGDFVFGVSMAVDGVDIGAPPQVLTVHIALDRGYGVVHIDICNANGDCAKYDVTVVNGVVTKIAFDGAFDSANMMYPSATGAAPGQATSWHWGLGTDADHFAQMVHQQSGFNFPMRSGCGGSYHYGLVVARVNGVFDSATWICIPNS